METQLGMPGRGGPRGPGGALAYLTCTVTREENAGVVKAFLESEEGAGFTLDQLCGPQLPCNPVSPPAPRPDAHSAVSLSASRKTSYTHFHAGEAFAGMKHIGNSFARKIHPFTMKLR